ncbi:excisionase family DNA-binding protein [Amycolatopsis sp. NBC_01307]|uniref:helix-turn-helix domain-containing protein n=1 Tax=unclassified Amycolatopsis TaxID=2618356 RepID=UPI002E141BB9|nr:MULTISPECIES: helix-turn-helix domain-containing protein [unclassified Amycolatopsis]WSJ75266.1 excisionase family DNA-binding protein [Amycolatopsis sp. NBC_01307]
MTKRAVRRPPRDLETTVDSTTPRREHYLKVEEVAEMLGTSVRFPRRLIEERRIEFVKVGRHVRIAESVVTAYIEARTVRPRPEWRKEVA